MDSQRKVQQKDKPNEQELDEHLKQITIEEWEAFFELIPEIENTKSFGTLKGGPIGEPFVIAPYYEEEPVVLKFSELVRTIPLMVIFDWPKWQEGIDLVQSDDPDFSQYSLQDLCRLITVIMRGDHFYPGFLVECFVKGKILKLIVAIKAEVSKMKEK